MQMHIVRKFIKVLAIIFFLYVYTFNCSIAANLEKAQLDNLSRVQGLISSHLQSMDKDLSQHPQDPIWNMNFSYISQYFTWLKPDLYWAVVRSIINHCDIDSEHNPNRGVFEAHRKVIPSKKIENITTSEGFKRVLKANSSESFEITGCCQNFKQVDLAQALNNITRTRPKTKCLHIFDWNVHEPEIAALSNAVNKLKDLSCINISSNDLCEHCESRLYKYLKGIPNNVSVIFENKDTLYFQSYTDDAIIDHLSHNLFSLKIPPNNLSFISLKKLNVNNNKLRTSSFEWLGSLSSLQHLDISGNDFSNTKANNRSISVFSNLHHLQSITADKIRVNLAFLDILKTLPSLTNLSIKETRINLKDAKKITQISTLEELKISEDKLTQSAFKKLNSVNLS